MVQGSCDEGVISVMPVWRGVHGCGRCGQGQGHAVVQGLNDVRSSPA